MSEQEKMNAVETEGTIIETKKDGWFTKLKKSPKTKKVVKGLIRVGEIAITGLLCFAAGKKAGGNAVPMTVIETSALNDDDDDDEE